MAQESRVMRNLTSFDKNAAERYVSMAQAALASGLKGEPRIEGISDGGTILGFKLKTTMPAYMVLSTTISRLGNMKKARFGKWFMNSLHLGLVPVYFASYNRMTMLKLWERDGKNFFDPNSAPLDEDNPVCWKLGDASMPPRLSSMNLVLLGRSRITRAPEKISELMNRYFSKFFWEVKGFDISSSTHFFYTDDKITTMVNVAKTVFTVKKVLGNRKIQILGTDVRCHKLLVAGLFRDADGYSLKNHEVLVEETIMESLGMDNIERKGFFNGIIAELTNKTGARPDTIKLFQVIASYNENYLDLIQDMVGIACINHFEDSESVTKVGTIQEIKNDVEGMVNMMARETDVNMTIGTSGDKWFENSIAGLFPMLLENDGILYYSHPLIWSHFADMRDKHFFDRDERMLENILVILDKIKTASRRELRNMDEFDLFRKSGRNVEDLKREIHELHKDISLSRSIRTHLDHPHG